ANSCLYTKRAISRLALYVLCRSHYAASLAGINSLCFRRWGDSMREGIFARIRRNARPIFIERESNVDF
ncbi:hypothetical protein O9402_19215, partial [Proteus mirabilis]|uniref:hypothetical protein n=1 Tax=Proteus mirabilis TaxID=584 RepID=UPI002578F149